MFTFSVLSGFSSFDVWSRVLVLTRSVGFFGESSVRWDDLFFSVGDIHAINIY